MAGRKQATATVAAAALLVVALLAIQAVAPAAAAGYTMCRVDVLRMAGACEKYCTRGSREAAPSNDCCAALKGADFPCLCRMKSRIASIGNIDPARAMQIPSKCRIPGAPGSC